MPPLLCHLLLAFLLASSISQVQTQSCSDIQGGSRQIIGIPTRLEWASWDSTEGILLTSQGNLYWTSTTGREWNVFKEFPESNRGIVIDFALSDGILWIVTNTQFYVSEDFGQTFTVSDKPSSRYSVEVYPHPENKEWAYMLWWSDRSRCQQVSATTECYQALTVTTDMGKTWADISKYVAKADWSEGHIWFLTASDPKANQIYLRQYSLYRYQLVNNPSHAVVVIEQGTSMGFLTYDNLVLRANRGDSTLRLYMSDNEGDNWVQAIFPPDDSGEELHEYGYRILDFNEAHRVFIGVLHSQELVHAYAGSVKDPEFTLVLNNVYINPQSGSLGFQKHYGLDGVIFANVIQNDVVNTLISSDDGGLWSRIPGDQEDCDIYEVKDCQVQLDLSNDYYDVWTQPDVPDILIAIGNYGTRLTDKWQIFFTREAGKVWEILAADNDEVSYYEVGDYGGLLLFADFYSDHFDFSLNQGLDWSTCDVPDGKQLVWLFTPHTQQTFFTTFTEDTNGNLEVGWLDFEELYQVDCQGQSQPGTSSSDYEYWYPFGKDQCILGQESFLIRRKRLSACDNDNQEPRIVSSICECTRADYECDQCYGLTDETSLTCKWVCEGKPPGPPEDCQGTYLQTQGYKKISSTQCQGNSEAYDPVEVPCSGSTSTSGTSTTTTTTGTTGTPATTGTTGTPATTGTTGTTGAIDGSGNNQQTSEDDNEGAVGAMTAVMVIAFVIGAVFLAFWMFKNRSSVPIEMRDIDDSRRT